MANRNFQRAKANKNDEFYTQLKDIEDELRHYKDHFKNKVVYCNADDPRVSNFFHCLDLAESMDKFAEKGEFMQGGPKFYLKEQDKEYKYRRLYDRIIIKNKKVIK